MQLISIGKNAAAATVTTFEDSPIPKKIIASGSSAIFGNGWAAATNGSIPERNRCDQPIANPMIVAGKPPIRNARNMRDKVAPECAII